MLKKASSSLFFAFVMLYGPPLVAQKGEAVPPAYPAAGGVERSTADAVQRNERNPLTLNISKDARDSRVALDYSLRWDFSDFRGFKPGIKTLYSLFRHVSAWDITENTRLKYYGFKTNPWRIFIAKENIAGSGAAAGAAENGAGGLRAESKKRLRLSLAPLVDDFRRDFDENLRDALLDASLKGASPQWAKISEKDKKGFVKDVLSLGIWDVPLPLVKEGREGLEYISK